MSKNKVLISMLFSFVGFLISLIVYPFIESQFIILWSQDNMINLEKFPFLFIVPFFSFILTLLIILISKIDKLDKNRKNDINVYYSLAIIFSLITNIIQIIIISYQFGFIFKFNWLFYISIGVLISFIGNYIPKLRPTKFSFLMYRLYLINPKEAIKSQRIRGYSLFFSGIFIMLCSILDNLFGSLFAIIWAIAILLVALLYNYINAYLKLVKGGAHK